MNYLHRISAGIVIFGFIAQSLFVVPVARAEEFEAAASATVTQIVFTTDPQTIGQNQVSAILTVQTRNVSNTAEAVSETTTLLVSSTSGTGEFDNASASAGCGTFTTVSQLTMSKNTSKKTFCYRDATAGTHTITVSAKDKSWSAAQQVVVITDTTPPSLLSAKTTSFTTIDVVFSEAMSATSLSAADFQITGHTVTAVAVRESTVLLTVSPALLRDEAPTVTLSGTVSDSVGNSLSMGSVVASVGLAPEPPTNLIIERTIGSPRGLINVSNVRAIGLTVDGPSSVVAGDVIRFTATDKNSLSIEADVVPPSGGGTTRLVFDTNTLADGPISWRVATRAIRGNESSPLIGSTFKDTAPPEQLELLINEGASHTNKIETNLTLRVTGANVVELSNDTTNFTDPIPVPAQGENFLLPWTIPIDHGLKTVSARFRDEADNTVTVSRSITLNGDLEDTISSKVEGGGQATLDQTGTSGMEIQLGAKSGTVGTRVASSRFSVNPSGVGLPTGTVVVGPFRDLSLSHPENAVLPVIVKLYFGQTELAAASVTSSKQILGLARLNARSGEWEVLPGGVNEPSDREGFLGYAFAQLNSFSPIALLADVERPRSPAFIQLRPGPELLELEWENVPEATSYVVEFRKRTSSRFVRVNVGHRTFTSIINLEPNEPYLVGVRAVDRGSNESDRVTGQVVTTSGTTVTGTTTEATPSITVLPPRPSAVAPKVAKKRTEIQPPTPTEEEQAAEAEVKRAEAADEGAKPDRRGQATLAVLVILAILAAAVIYRMFFREIGSPVKPTDTKRERNKEAPKDETAKW